MSAAEEQSEPAESAEPATRVVIADDHAVVRTGLKMVLDAEEGAVPASETTSSSSAASSSLAESEAVLAPAFSGTCTCVSSIAGNCRSVTSARSQRTTLSCRKVAMLRALFSFVTMALMRH